MATTITIKRKRLTDGFQWGIVNWDEYLAYLKANHFELPLMRYGITISSESREDFERDHGNFEKQVPELFQIGDDATVKFV